MKKKVISLVAVMCMCACFLFLHCGENGINPYIHPSNAGIIIMNTSTVADKDTITIFSSKKIELALLLREYIDSLKIHIPKNRLWSQEDTVIRKNDLTSSYLTILFSLYDTGSIAFLFTVYRSDGSLTEKSLQIYARSPLSQKSISGGIGDTIILETRPVDDAAFYTWDLKGGVIIKNESWRTTHILQTQLTDSFGELYVSDRLYHSPSVRFATTATDQPRTVTFTKDTSSVREPGQAQVGIMLSFASALPVTVKLASDTAASTAGKEDYLLPDSTITFAPGQVARTIIVTVLDDKIAEPTETLIIKLTSVSGASTVLGAVNKHTIWIKDNDFALKTDVFPAHAGNIICKVNGVVDTGPYSTGTEVEVSAVAGSGYRFGYFSGAKNTLANQIRIRIDTLQPSVTAVFVSADAPSPGILREVWLTIPGDSIASLTADTSYPDHPSRTDIIVPFFETETNLADNYGQRLRAFIIPQQTGDYTFWISSDNQSQLFLGVNDIASTAIKIASVPSFTGIREWDKFASQKSAPITLTAGKRYYIEALHKESMDADHMSVGWKCAGVLEEKPVPAYRLTPYIAPNAPVITAQPKSQTVLAGETATFSISVTGTPPLTYQWYRDSAAIPGAVAAGYTTPPTTPAENNASFKCVVKNNAGPAASLAALLTVHYPPAITTQPLPQTANIGQAVSFSVVATGNPAPSYQWEKNGNALAGATSAVFIMQSLTLADSGLYAVRVSNSLGAVKSEAVKLTVTPVGFPVIITHPVTQTVNEGQPAAFTVAATGNPPLSYQWEKNGAAIPLATAHELFIPAAALGDTGYYTVVVTNTLGSDTSNRAYLTVKALCAPIITEQPKDSQTVKAGLPAGFTVIATGNPLPRYQWQKSGSAVPGETLSVYAIASAVLTDSGTYAVVVFNTLDTIISKPAHLKVLSKPVLIQQPKSLAVKAGQPAQFSVTATGYPLPSYQWNKNGFAIPKETLNVLAISPVTLSDTGLYTVVASNTEGSAISDTARLTVFSRPAITVQPRDSQTVKAGQQVQLFVKVNGYPLPSYQWLKNGAVMPNETLSVLTLSPITLADSGYYRVIAANSEGSDTSITAHITVNAKPVIIQQPKSLAVKAGLPAQFSVTATGNPLPAYQWNKNGFALSKETLNVLTISSVALCDTGLYAVVVSNTEGSARSDTARLTVFSKPVITVQPRDSQTVKAGQQVQLFVKVNGYPPPSYQWLKNGAVMPSETLSVLTLSPITLADSGYYRVIAANSEGSDTSTTAHIAVAAKPVIIEHPKSLAVKAGLPAQFSVTATGNPLLAYQWNKNGFAMPNETLSVLTISTVTLSDTGLYTVVVSNTEGKDTSDEARLAVFFKPVITTQPKDTQVINAGKPVHFTVWASGNPSPKYQWGKNGLGIPKETLNVLTIPSVVMSDSGKYTVVVSNSEGSVVSDTARLIVKPPLTKPVITTQPKDSQAVLIGSKVTLSVSATGNPLPSYQWNKNGFSMPKETLNVLTISSVTVSDTGLYTVVVSNSEGSIISNQARLYIDLSSGPVIIKQPEPQTVSTGQSATFSVTAIGTPPLLYQWKKDNSTIGSATTSVYTINPASPLDSGSYKVVIQNSKGSVVSNAVKLTVTGEMSLIPQPVPQTAHKEF